MADLYADNVGQIKSKLANLNTERISNYDTMANNITQQFSGPTGTLAEFQDKWSEVQKLGEGEMMGHLIGKGALKGAGKLYGRYQDFKAAKTAKIQSKNAEEMKGNAEDVPELTQRQSVSTRSAESRTTDLDAAQDVNEDALGRGSDASNYVNATRGAGGEGSDIIDSQSDLNLPGRQARQTTNLDDLIGDDTPTPPAPTPAAPATTTINAPEPAPASAENPALDNTTDAGGDFDDTLAGAGSREEVQAAATQGRSLGTTFTRLAPDIDNAGEQVASLGSRMVGSIQSAGQSAFKTLAERGSKGYLKAAGQKIGSLFKSSATDTAATAAETGAETGAEVATELTTADAVLGAVPIVGEVALGISGVVALGEGIYHLFHKPEAPPPPKLVAPIQVPSALTAKYSAALPSADNSLDRGASSVSF